MLFFPSGPVKYDAGHADSVLAEQTEDEEDDGAGDATGKPATAAVTAEAADADPAEFDALTTTRIVAPTSAEVST